MDFTESERVIKAAGNRKQKNRHVQFRKKCVNVQQMSKQAKVHLLPLLLLFANVKPMSANCTAVRKQHFTVALSRETQIFLSQLILLSFFNIQSCRQTNFKCKFVFDVDYISSRI